ncbi:MAG: menaquinone biosynthesis protein [Thermodesulfobacteriota bacterium]|nr:menaquinone biosynthesis protein [Thermodesulfobacteriota bacterium]
MPENELKIGQINYLNLLPLFYLLKKEFPNSAGVSWVEGHPSEMNAALDAGKIDLSPASAFEYLYGAEKYHLLPDLSVAAPFGPVKSVLLASPVPLEKLPAYLKDSRGKAYVTSASASSTALLSVLWKYFWKFPPVDWEVISPGTGLNLGGPFLEIGDLALKLYLNTPPGLYLIDLAQAWYEHTGLPFVFAVWIVRRGLGPVPKNTLAKVHEALISFKGVYKDALGRMIEDEGLSSWLTEEQAQDYFDTVGYDLGPEEQAGLILFGDFCRKLGLISGVPGLSWAGDV